MVPAGGERLSDSSTPTDGLLERVANALNSPLELKDVLKLFAEIAREATGAARCTFFLLEGTQLYPAVSIGKQPAPEQWETFRTMNPVDVDPDRAIEFLDGHAVAIEDARTSDLIPMGWVDQFALRGVALVALRCGGVACGLMALDWNETRTFTAQELRVVEALAAYVGVAVGNARPFETVRRRARLQTALARAAATLAVPLAPSEIVDLLVDAYHQLLSPRICAIAVVDLERWEMRAVAARNAGRTIQPISLSQVPEHIVSQLGAAWATDKRPLELGDEPWFDEFLGTRALGVAWSLVLPLVAESHTTGGVLLGFDEHTRLDAEERAAAEALAAIGAAALERHELLDRLARQLRQLDALYHMSAALTEGANADTLVAGLNGLLSKHGVEVVGVTFRNKQLARHLGGDAPTPEERVTWRAKEARVELPDGSLAIPMRLGRRVVGTLRVRPGQLGSEQLSFLETLATGLADVASRGALRAEIEEANRDRAVVNERDRMAADLHDTAGQLFVALGLLAGRLQEQLTHDAGLSDQARRIVELAERGKEQINQAVRALTFLPAAQRGLARSVRALARSVAFDSALDIAVEIHGRPVRLPGRSEQALYRVAHEALTNAWRHARGSQVRVDLRFEAEHVVLRVTDDGIGIGRKNGNGEGLHVGIMGMRRAISEVGGSFRVAKAEPHGTLVEARVAKEAR